MNRRAFFGTAAAAAGAVAAAPLLAGCGQSGASGTGTTSASQIAKIMPSYVPSNLIKPQYASVDGSSPGFLTYPKTLVHTVHDIPGDGGSYTGITPLWASIPSPSGNTYYSAVNKALGATITMQPSNGNTYNNILPPLFSGNKLPDWIQIPTFWTAPLNFGQAVGAKLADLTPYLAGDKVKQYPNLAALFPGAWQAGIWNNKIYGIPVFPTEFTVAGVPVLPGRHPGPARHRHPADQEHRRPVQPGQGDQRPEEQAVGVRRHLDRAAAAVRHPAQPAELGHQRQG